MKMRHAVILTGIAIAILALATVGAQNSGQIKDGVFIHISHGADNPQSVLMGLNMASMMSNDRDVLVYFDVKGVNVTLKDGDDLTYASFPSSKSLLGTLREKGATLMVCPTCLKAAGKTAGDLAPGMSMADKNKFFSFTKGKILTLNY